MKTLNNYTQWLQKQNFAPNTINNYLQAVRLYGEKQLNTANLSHYLKSNLTKHEPSTLYTRFKALTVYAKFKQLKVHWEKVAKLIPKVQKKFRITIKEQELSRLKTARFEENNWIYERNNLILDLLFYTGIRVGELVNLKWSDFNDGLLRIHGKGNKVRRVFVPEFLLKNWKNPYSPIYLFSTTQGKPLPRVLINQLLWKRTEMAGISKRITPHTFRRSLATNLYNRGGKLETIQKQLGHSSSDTTLGYIHNDRATLYQDYSKLFLQPNQATNKPPLKDYSTPELLAEISKRVGNQSTTEIPWETNQNEPERRNYV